MNPSGTILAFAGTTIPDGYLLCDGSYVSSTTYPNLFSAIGNAFGPHAPGFFTLPDLRGKVVLGSGNYGFLNDVITQNDTAPGHKWGVPANCDKWLTGQKVTFSADPLISPGGFTAGHTYFVFRESNTVIYLCATLEDALKGNGINYTSNPDHVQYAISRGLTSRTLASGGGEEGHFMQLSEANNADLNFLVDESQSLGTPDGVSVLAGSDGGDTQQVIGNISYPWQAANVMQPYLVLNWIIKV